MTRPGLEPRSPGPLANTLPTRPMSRLRKLCFTSSSWAITAAETTKNICCAEVKEQLVTITRQFKEFYLGCKNLDDQARSGWPKTEFQTLVK